jgi:hypothetical protein
VVRPLFYRLNFILLSSALRYPVALYVSAKYRAYTKKWCGFNSDSLLIPHHYFVYALYIASDFRVKNRRYIKYIPPIRCYLITPLYGHTLHNRVTFKAL